MAEGDEAPSFEHEPFEHRPVMAAEVTDLLAAVPTGLAVDATVGGGGHARSLLTVRPDLRLLGIDRDPVAVAAAARKLEPFGDRVTIRQGGFEQVAEFVGNEGIVAILFDLGVSSPQLDRPVRGFSYWADAAPPGGLVAGPQAHRCQCLAVSPVRSRNQGGRRTR